MFYNLVDNAVKYNREGGWIKVSLDPGENGPVFTVEDNGIGIAREEQDRIFERFYRVDKSHSRKTGGTGLGLSIVETLIQIQGGQFALDIQGDLFTARFTVPKADGKEMPCS